METGAIRGIEIAESSNPDVLAAKRKNLRFPTRIV
jgi:hypothetical protein